MITLETQLLWERIDRYLKTHTPCGQEDELAVMFRDDVASSADRVWMDPLGNVFAQVGAGEGGMAVVAHTDEISLIVKRIEPDGRLRCEPLGGAYPWKYGEGPMEVLGDRETVPAILTVGCGHTSAETTAMQQARTGPLTWETVRLDTGLSPERLVAAGVHPGSRAVIHRSRKTPFRMGPFIGGYALDDKVAVAVMAEVMRAIYPVRETLRAPIYFVASVEEEIGAATGGWVAHTLRVDSVLALEIGPCEPEYGTRNDGRPIVWYKDAMHTYDKRMSDALIAAGETVGCGAQYACLTSAGTDASKARTQGLALRTGCISFPASSTHGYEYAHTAGIENLARVTAAFLRREHGAG